jgi:hypothetical protein
LRGLLKSPSVTGVAVLPNEPYKDDPYTVVPIALDVVLPTVKDDVAFVLDTLFSVYTVKVIPH